TSYVMVNENDADNPGGGFPIRYSESLPPEGYGPGGWNGAQNCQGPDPSSVIPKDPCCRIGLLQSYDLRHHHWDQSGREPERGGNRTNIADANTAAHRSDANDPHCAMVRRQPLARRVKCQSPWDGGN